MDKYNSFEELNRAEPEGSFSVRVREGVTGVIVMAPHGGGIEPGTSEVADAIAGGDHSFYAFEGRKPERNRDLHITSTNFDEPQAVTLVSRSERVLTIHGCAGSERVIYAGGLDADFVNDIRRRLVESGFRVEWHSDPTLQGKHASNICNRGATGRGAQLELSEGLRIPLFENLRSRSGREQPTRVFDALISAVRRAMAEMSARS